MASSRRAAPFATAIYARVDDRALGVRCIEGVGRFVFIERLERGGGWGSDLSNPCAFFLVAYPIPWRKLGVLAWPATQIFSAPASSITVGASTES